MDTPRNYLIPRGLAVMATRSNLKQVEHEKAVQVQRAAKLRGGQEKLIADLQKVVLMVAKEAGDDGKLYGSVTSADVFEALEAKKIDVDKRKLIMPEKAIKEVGSYEVGVKFPYGLTAKFKLEVKTRA